MHVRYCPDAPGREWAVHRDLIEDIGIVAVRLVGDWSMQTKSVARLCLRSAGFNRASADGLLFIAEQCPTPYDDLLSLSEE